MFKDKAESLNILTVDLEDWFVVENLKANIDSSEWKELPSRVEANTIKLLELFHDYDVRATFFVLGWIAEKFPGLIGQIAYAGHEVACHSYAHQRIDRMGEKAFRDDTQKALDVIIKTSGFFPVGYRAPSWSINSSIPWAFEVLADLGFKYDSSIYPVSHDIYGEPDAPRSFFKMILDSGRILYEVPASTISMLGKNIPFGGGGYLRLSPYWYTARMMRRLNRARRPVVVYIHPWEIDEHQPRVRGLSMFQRYRQYGAVSALKKKMENLLAEFDFVPMGEYVDLLTKKKIGFENS